MAGIGFRLQKLLKEDSYTGLIKGYLFSAIISSGPMLTSIICIALLGIVSLPVLSNQEYLLFRSTIVYVFAFSLIFTGMFQMIVTRYLADRLFVKEPNSMIPCYTGLLIITVIGQSIMGSIFFYHVLPQWKYVMIATSLYVTISCLWNTMIFISATKNYLIIVWGFVIGSIVSFTAGYFMGDLFGLYGYLLGFELGQFIIFQFMLASLLREFDFYKPIDFNFLHYFRKYPELCILGCAINLGVWIDKFLFWFSPFGTQIQGFFHTCPVYDSAFFLAYLTIVPALSIFLVQVETSFYHKYRDYYALIMRKASLPRIESAKENIIADLKDSMISLLKVQGFISIILLIGAMKVVQIARLQWAQLIIFKIGLLSAFLLIFFQLLLIIMLYFEFRKEALWLTVLFIAVNICATLLTIQFGFRSFGYGFFSACFVSLFVGYFIFNRKLDHLEFLTFMSQPIRKVEI